jgi:hypothetical protein
MWLALDTNVAANAVGNSLGTGHNSILQLEPQLVSDLEFQPEAQQGC